MRVLTAREPSAGDLARVHRGIATGYNAFFVLSEERRAQLGIPLRHLVPRVASPRYFAGATLTNNDLAAMDDSVPRWLLSLKQALRSGPLASYRHGRGWGTDTAMRSGLLAAAVTRRSYRFLCSAWPRRRAAYRMA